MRIGVIGGTFDPLHNGHLAIAEEAMKRLALAEVFFVPASRPWLKADQPVTAVEHRVAMVRRAIAASPQYRLSTVEAARPGPSYAVDTIAELQLQYGTGADLYFILGWDSLSELPRWHRPSRLIAMCYLVAVPRPGQVAPDLDSLETRVPGISQRLILLDGPTVDVSATGIRQRVALGQPVDHLVPGPVEQYIRQHRLYLARQG